MVRFLLSIILVLSTLNASTSLQTKDDKVLQQVLKQHNIKLDLTIAQLKKARQIKDPSMCGLGYVETRLIDHRVSNKGAIGIFQKLPKYAKDRNRLVKNIHNVEYAKKVAENDLKYWSEHKLVKGNKIKKLMCYNGGINWTKSKAIYKATYKYAMNVIKAEQEFKKLKKIGLI